MMAYPSLLASSPHCPSLCRSLQDREEGGPLSSLLYTTNRLVAYYQVKMNRMRQRIAERLKDAQNTNAMLTTFNEVDMR